ncbi:hypothetical protein WKT22_05346 [Candidatus Lokiarchaeum ossiferum]
MDQLPSDKTDAKSEVISINVEYNGREKLKLIVNAVFSFIAAIFLLLSFFYFQDIQAFLFILCPSVCIFVFFIKKNK